MYTDFEFAGKRLSDFGYIICKFGGSSDLTDVEIGCDITFSTVKNNHSSIHYNTSSSYENVYTTSLEIMKNPCNKNQDEMYHINEEISMLTSWLNRREYYKFKPLTEEDNFYSVHYYGSFNVKEKTINDRVVGFIINFTGNAPYGFGDNVSLEYDIVSAGENIYVHSNSDEYGVIYPHLSITLKEDGDLQITNTSNGLITEIKNCVSGETIRINGEHKFIDSDNEQHKTTTLFNDFNYEYLRLQVEDDDFSENVFEVSLPCIITFGYYPIRKVAV